MCESPQIVTASNRAVKQLQFIHPMLRSLHRLREQSLKSLFLVSIVDMLVPYETKFQFHEAKIQKSLIEDLRQASTLIIFKAEISFNMFIWQLKVLYLLLFQLIYPFICVLLIDSAEFL